jgi:hypothetical protein
LSVIDDKASYPAIIEICKNPRYGSARQMLMGILAKSKCPEAYIVLVVCLDDKTVLGHAIKGLGKFGSVEYNSNSRKFKC